MFGLSNQQAGKYIFATKLELIRFCSFPLEDLMWNLITQVNDGDLAAYITVFDLSRYKGMCFTPFLVYDMVYLSISRNLVTLATLSHWSGYVFMHDCYPFLSKPLLR